MINTDRVAMNRFDHAHDKLIVFDKILIILITYIYDYNYVIMKHFMTKNLSMSMPNAHVYFICGA